MKKIFLILAIITTFINEGISQIPGKIYSQGDTVNINGINSLIIKVDDSGLHGLVIALSDYTSDDNIKKFEKLKKGQVKKGELTDEDMQIQISEFKNFKGFRSIQTEKRKGNKKFFNTKEFVGQLEQGWRLPTREDAAAWGQFLWDISNGHMNVYNKPRYNPNTKSFPDLWPNYIYDIAHGFIGCDENNINDIIFFRVDFGKSKSRFEYIGHDGFIGNENSVAIKNF